jgi:hypothetical protein
MFNRQNQLKDTRTAINAEQIIWLKGTRFRSNARNTGWNPAVIMGDSHVFCCSMHCFLLGNFMHNCSAMDEGLEDSVTINPYSVL